MSKSICYSCLKDCDTSFCYSCRKELFNGKRVKNVLGFSLPEFTDLKLRASNRISISGVQLKHSLKLEKNKLQFTESTGEFILKPIPHGTFLHLDQTPANEHLTMQIAKQLFEINVAANAFILFADGQPAYITKRFDISPTGIKLSIEDFAQIAQKTEESDGADYKYSYSYEEVAELIKKFVAASIIELDKFFRLVVFNYVISNGDAHLKNFSLLRNEEYGDYLLTPAYDLLCTRLHSPYESDMALELFKERYETESYKHGAKYTTEDFIEFGRRLGINADKVQAILRSYNENEAKVSELVTKSFLSTEMKEEFVKHYRDKCERIRI